jgi:hypothetical protein
MWLFEDLSDLREVFWAVLLPCTATIFVFMIGIIIFRPIHPSRKVPRSHKRKRRLRQDEC